MTLNLEICVNCWNYQHRLNWMLCSVLQQQGDIPNIVFNVSYVPKNGNPITEDVCSFFKDKGLNVKSLLLKDVSEVACRGKIRQKQMDESKADWILFADCDMVYDKMFFSTLGKRLTTDLKDVTKLITADRVSLDIKHCIKYFEEDCHGYPKIIEDVSDVVAKWPVFRVTGKGIGPGNFQLANVHYVKNNNIFYTNTCRDLWRATRSDKHFRKNMGGIHPIDGLPKQYHLNHDREGPDKQR